MHSKRQVIVIGDVHGEFAELSMWAERERPRMILQCGDFGYWPNISNRTLYGRESPHYPTTRPGPTLPEDCTLHWCDGNHEDFWALRDRKSDELYHGVFYMPRGSILTLPDGRTVLFVGGAESRDKEWRVAHEKAGGDKVWFAEERLSHQDIIELPDTPVDVIISHAAPREFSVWGGMHDMLPPDPSRLALSAVLHRYKEHRPLWFFGHYHTRIAEEYQGVKYFGMNMIGYPDWSMPLPEAGG